MPSRAIVSIRFSKSKDHDNVIFAKIWKDLSKRLIKQIKRFYLDKAYWSENTAGLINQNQITPIIPPKKNSIDHGTESPLDQIVRAHQKYPGLYHHNHQPQKRSSVEHVFGLIKLQEPKLRDRKAVNKVKTLLTPFLWYNHKLHVKGVKS